MVDHTTIIECLRGLVGFEPSIRMNQAAVDDDLLTAESGIYVNNLHPLLTYDNISAIAEQFNNAAIKEWGSDATYNKGDLVQSAGVIYRSLTNNNGHELTENEFWQETTLLSAFLRKTYDASVVKLFNQLFTDKKLNEVAKSLLGRISLYEGVGNITGRITKTGRMVGFKLNVKHPDTVAKLSHIGLQLDTVQNGVTIYLYHTSSNQPLTTFVFNQTRSVQFQWHAVEQTILANLDDTINAGGTYYLTYYEDELTGSAIKKDYSFAGRDACGTCSESVANTRLFNQWSKYVSLQPFYVNSIDLPKNAGTLTHALWDETKEIEVGDSTWGLNLQLTVQCDVSDLICRSKSVMATALSQQIVVDMLNAMAYSLRNNNNRDKIAGLAAVALDNTENHEAGEQKKLRKAMEALSFDLSSLSDVCLPCNGASGAVRKKTVWG